MIEFPSTTAVNRILPKDKFVEHLDLTPNLKKKLISDVVHIKIMNKFSSSVLNFIDCSSYNRHCEERRDVAIHKEEMRDKRQEIRELTTANESPCWNRHCEPLKKAWQSKPPFVKATAKDGGVQVATGSDSNCCGVRRMSDGRVTEFEANHSLMEQISSQAKGVKNTLSLNKVCSSSVTPQSAKADSSPQVEPLGEIPQGEALEKITEVLLLQIELKKPDFDSKLIEVIARQNPHKLVFLLRFQHYAKLAVYYKKLYIGSWKPFEEVTLTLNGNNMNEVWFSFVGQIALYERGVVGGGRDCSKASTRGEVSRSDGRVTEFEVNSSLMKQVSSQGNWIATQSSTARNDVDDIGGSNTLSLNKVCSSSVTPQSAKADSSPQVEPLGEIPQGEALGKCESIDNNSVLNKSQLDYQLDLQNKAEILKKEIAKLESAIRKEKQPKRKFEIHRSLLELKESLGRILDFRG